MRNPIYSDPAAIRKIRAMFYQRKDFPSIQLGKFFEEGLYRRIISEIKKSIFSEKKHVIEYRYHEAPLSPLAKKAAREISEFLSSFLNKKVKLSLRLYSFTWKEYTLLNDGGKERGKYDIIFDCTESWDEKAGGSIIYVDGTGDFSRIPPQKSALFIAERKKSRKFMQYINHYGKGKKRFLLIGTA